MANCDLSIELIDGDRPVRGGERVRGTVIVRPDGDFNCKGLEISTRWETHGRGNIDSGEIEKVVAFQGQWLAGQTYRYDFDLPSGIWPPTYHGEALSVDHVVRATARLPWKTDPTVAHPFRVYVNTAPESGAPPSSSTKAGPITKVLLTVLFGAVGLFFLLNPLFWCIGVVVALCGGVWWFFRRWMPSRKLGEVNFTVENSRLCPGEMLRGELVLSPKRNITLNGITMHLTAKEICVSGSGSNRTTHSEVVYEDRVSVIESGELRGGEQHRLPVEVVLPMRPIYSMDLSDNDVVWEADVRIDIPRWPDWRAQQKFSVVPPAEPAAAAALLPGAATDDQESFVLPAAERVEASPARLSPAGSTAEEEPGISFGETASLIWANREQPDMVRELTDAVQGLAMDVSLKIDRRSLYRETDEPAFASPEGTVFFASYEDPMLPVLLYVPVGSLSEIAEIERRGRWSGLAQIVGYDAQQRRLLVKAEG